MKIFQICLLQTLILASSEALNYFKIQIKLILSKKKQKKHTEHTAQTNTLYLVNVNICKSAKLNHCNKCTPDIFTKWTGATGTPPHCIKHFSDQSDMSDNF